jgi:hypothetical protein
MNKNHCWYNLDIDISTALSDSWQWESSQHKNNMRKYKADEIFSNSWLDTMKTIDIPIIGSLVHYKSKWHSSMEAHVDTYNGVGGAAFGINWVIGGQGSEMVWYELPDEKYRGIGKMTPANTPYMAWRTGMLREIDRCEIKSNAVLVRVDRPHAIVVKNQDRLSISARTNMKLMIWEDIVNYLHEKNLLVERD